MSVQEWKRAVDGGKLSNALAKLKAPKHGGHWEVLCDNESFLRAALVSAAHKKAGVKL